MGKGCGVLGASEQLPRMDSENKIHNLPNFCGSETYSALNASIYQVLFNRMISYTEKYEETVNQHSLAGREMEINPSLKKQCRM